MKKMKKIGLMVLISVLAVLFVVAIPKKVYAAPWPGVPEAGEQTAVIVDQRETISEVFSRNIKGYTIYFIKVTGSYSVPYWDSDPSNGGWSPGYGEASLDTIVSTWEGYTEERIMAAISDKCPIFRNASPASKTSNGGEEVYIDRDTYKSCLTSGSILTKPSLSSGKVDELKAHEMSSKDLANQKLLLNAYATQNKIKTNVIASYDIFTKRDLTTSENGANQVLIWKNLTNTKTGNIYALCYNQTDGAYWISGVVDAFGTATFTGYKFRPASSITIFQ